jgi:hypothetical protein
MKIRHFALACLAGLALAGSGFAQVEADPNKEYAVVPEVGPWMIYATHFVGPEASQLAHEMVLEIRSRYNLPAWVYNRSEEERQKQRERVRELRERYRDFQNQIPIKTTRIQEQCAVLVGGYKDFDAASRALKKFKTLNPPVADRLKPQVIVINPGDREKGEEDQVYKDYGNPFANSFVARNPTVRFERQTDKKQDLALIQRLNANESLSLLKCKGRYSLAVAAYAGPSALVPETTSTSFLDKLWGKNAGDMLQASGLNAHALAQALRDHPAKFEAYVLHLKGGSLVSIGGFERSDDPRMQSVQQAFARFVRGAPNLQGVVSEPFPIEVPR